MITTIITITETVSLMMVIITIMMKGAFDAFYQARGGAQRRGASSPCPGGHGLGFQGLVCMGFRVFLGLGV